MYIFFLANKSKASPAKQKFIYCSVLLSRQQNLHRCDAVFIKTIDISLNLAGYIGAISLGRKNAIMGPNIGVILLRIRHDITGVVCTILAANMREILFFWGGASRILVGYFPLAISQADVGPTFPRNMKYIVKYNSNILLKIYLKLYYQYLMNILQIC